MTLRDSLAQVQELKPCPFCGGEPKFTEVGSDLSKSRKLTIQCKGCRFKLTNAAMRHGFDWLYEITITAWNTRHGAGDADRSAELTTAWMAGAESVRERAAEAWRPIESAPRDGSYILVCNSHGSWIAKYQHFYPSGYRPSSPWASMMLNHDHIERPGRFDHPTHWRPLPAPPTDDAARAGERG